MMTIEEMEKKMAELENLHAETENLHAKLKAQIAELKKLEEEMPSPPHPRWIPEDKGCYYYLDEGGWITETNREGFSLKDKYEIGNVFKTIDAAKFAAERLKVIAEMREWAGKWNDTYAIACVMVMNGEAQIMVNDRLSTLLHGEMRFATMEDARNCIDAVGEDRIIKYYFMIPEVRNGETTS